MSSLTEPKRKVNKLSEQWALTGLDTNRVMAKYVLANQMDSVCIYFVAAIAPWRYVSITIQFYVQHRHFGGAVNGQFFYTVYGVVNRGQSSFSISLPCHFSLIEAFGCVPFSMSTIMHMPSRIRERCVKWCQRSNEPHDDTYRNVSVIPVDMFAGRFTWRWASLIRT